MTSPESLSTPSDSFTVATVNVLMNKTLTKAGIIHPQAKRIPSVADAFLSSGIDPDIIAVQEAELALGVHGGEELARRLGLPPGYCVEHNQLKRHDEYMCMIGNRLESPESFDIGFGKKAVMTKVGKTAVVGYHPKRQLWGREREWQTGPVLDRVSEFKNVVLLVDTNALWFEKSRRMIARAGFRSAFHECGYKRPRTFPTEPYRDIMLTPWQQKLLPDGFSIDDIYVRGMDVEDVGVLHADTDHLGLWARVKPKH